MKDLFFRLLAKDQTQAAFGAVGRALRNVEAGAKRAQDRVSAWGTSMQSVGLGIAAMTAGVGAMLGSSLSAFDQMAVAQARVDKALQTTGGAAGFTRGELEDMAEELERLTRFSKADILGGVSAQFISLRGVTGDVFTRAQGLALDMATAFNTDAAGAAKSLGEALQDPINGVGALGEVGVRFNASQTEMIKKLVEGGKAAEAQTYILDQLAYAMGGQAAAAAAVGVGALDGFAEAWRNIQIDVGRAATAILGPMAKIARGVSDAFLGLPEPVRNAAVAFGIGATALGVMAIAAGAAAIAIGALTAPILIIGAAVTGLIALVGALTYYWDDVTAAGRVAWLGLQAVVLTATQAMLDRVIGFANTAVNTFEGAVAGIQAFWSTLPDGIGSYVILSANAVIGGVEKLLNGARERINTFLGGINAGAEFFGLSAPISLIPEVKMGRIEGDETGAAIAAAWDGAFSDQQRFEVPDLGGAEAVAELQAAYAALGGRVESVVDPLAGVADAVDDTVKILPDSTSELDGVGDSAKGAGKGLGELKDKAKETKDEVKGAFDGIGSDVSASLSDMVKDGEGNFSSLSEGILSIGENMRDRLLSAVFDPIGKAFEGFLTNMISGAGSSGGGVGGIIGSIAGMLPGFDTGADFVAGGKSGIDRNVAAFRVSAGERVRVTRAGESGGGGNVTVNINTPDPAAFKASSAQISAQIARAVARGQRTA